LYAYGCHHGARRGPFLGSTDSGSGGIVRPSKGWSGPRTNDRKSENSWPDRGNSPQRVGWRWNVHYRGNQGQPRKMSTIIYSRMKRGKSLLWVGRGGGGERGRNRPGGRSFGRLKRTKTLCSPNDTIKESTAPSKASKTCAPNQDHHSRRKKRSKSIVTERRVAKGQALGIQLRPGCWEKRKEGNTRGWNTPVLRNPC